MHTPAAPSAYFRLSLLGHQLMDALRGIRKAAPTQAPVLRYALAGTLGLAVMQAATQERAGDIASAEETQVATASLFGGAPSAVENFTEDDLDALKTYTPAIARYSKELALDGSALAAATLLSARGKASVNVQRLARGLQAAAVNENAVTPGGWVAAAATLFEDARAADDLTFLIQRYSL